MTWNSKKQLQELGSAIIGSVSMIQTAQANFHNLVETRLQKMTIRHNPDRETDIPTTTPDAEQISEIMHLFAQLLPQSKDRKPSQIFPTYVTNNWSWDIAKARPNNLPRFIAGNCVVLKVEEAGAVLEGLETLLQSALYCVSLPTCNAAGPDSNLAACYRRQIVTDSLGVDLKLVMGLLSTARGITIRPFCKASLDS
jgi:hypothetical protein